MTILSQLNPSLTALSLSHQSIFCNLGPTLATLELLHLPKLVMYTLTLLYLPMLNTLPGLHGLQHQPQPIWLGCPF